MERRIIILLRDSEPERTACLRLASILQTHGHEVCTVLGVTPELAKLHFNPPALILTPVHLAGIGAFELCRSFRKRELTRRTPFLILTSNASQEEEAFKAGASDVISMPVRESEALARVQTHLELASFRAEASKPFNFFESNRDGWIALAMQSARMCAFDWDLATDRLRSSREFSAVLGLEKNSKDETLTSALRYAHPHDRECLERVLKILSPAYDAFDMQMRVQRPGGTLAHLRVSGRGLFDAARRLARIIGVAVDITEQVAAQEELRQSRGDLRELIHKLPFAAALVSERGSIESLNEQFSGIFADGLENFAAAPSEDSLPRECEIAGKDGAIHRVDLFSAAVGRQKLLLSTEIVRTSAGASARNRDGMREDSERWLRSMADLAPVMLWVCDPNKLCTFFNKAWLSFTGRTVEQEAGDGWIDGVHPDDLERSHFIYNAAFEKREGFRIEYRLRRADGEYRLILDTAAPRFAADGSFAGYVGSAIDITDFKHTQEHLLAAQKLENLNLLAGGVAHDINNLLSCILAHAHIAMSELEINSPVRDGLERIESVAVRASQIGRRLMAFIGEEQEDLEAVDLANLVQETAQLVRVFIPGRVKIDVDLPQSLVIPQANACQLRQVVMNLIVNAGEAIGDRGGLISITGARGCWYHPCRTGNGIESAEGRFVCLEVSDTGAGMTAEVKGRIFDPFFSTKAGGRGLGLAAAQAIVRNHGGIIDVSSEPGKGSTIQILLPSESKPPVPIQAPQPFNADSSRRGSVLIVEDEGPLRTSVAKMLSKKGFSVVEASDGNLAVDVIRDPSQDIALVLLDVTLRGKSSQEVFAELQRFRPRVKVIVTSAYGRDNIAGPLKALDSRMFLRKPYHLADLVTVVGQALPKDAGQQLVGAGPG